MVGRGKKEVPAEGTSWRACGQACLDCRSHEENRVTVPSDSVKG